MAGQDVPIYDLQFNEKNHNEPFACSICHDFVTLGNSAAHECIVDKTKNKYFLALITDKPDKFVLPMPDSENAYYTKKENFNITLYRCELSKLQGIKKLILLKKSCTAQAVPQDFTSSSPASDEFNCSVCLKPMTLEQASKHHCILENTKDPQGRFMVIDKFKEFYPVVEQGTHFLYLRPNESKELVVFKSPIEEFTDHSPTFKLVNEILLENSSNQNLQSQSQADLEDEPSVTEQLCSSNNNGQSTSKKVTKKTKNKSAGIASKNFSEKEDLALIRAVEVRQAIWNFKLPMSARLDKKRLYEEIATQVPDLKHKTAHELQSRWENIVTARNRNAQNNKKKCVSGSGATKETLYKYDDCMQFLNNIDMDTQQTTSNISENQAAVVINKENMTPDEDPNFDDDSGPTSNGPNNKYKRKAAPTTAESFNNIAKAMNAPINITLPPMPQFPASPSVPTPPLPTTADMNDEDIWWLNIRRYLRRLSPRKRQTKMDDIEYDVQRYVRDAGNGTN